MEQRKGGWHLVDTAEAARLLGLVSGETAFVSGNTACAYSALISGVTFFAGYPITPSSEIFRLMQTFLPRFGGVAYAPEDEIASIGMVIGASLCGKKAMTATSGPGLSLMQEELGYAIINEVPLVIVNAMRIGPSTGQPTKPASADISASIYGRHGDGGECVVVLSPSSVTECFFMTIGAFNIAEQFRVPVIIALDGYLSQLEEQFRIPRHVWVFDRIGDSRESLFGTGGRVSNFIPIGGKRIALYAGTIHDTSGRRSTYDTLVCQTLIEHLLKKHTNVAREAMDIAVYRHLLREEYRTRDCEYLIVSYGVGGRAAKDTVEDLRRNGIAAGALLLKMLWPLHEDLFKPYASVSRVVVAENNTGQLFPLLSRYIPNAEWTSFTKYNGSPIRANDLYDFCSHIFRKHSAHISEPSICATEFTIPRTQDVHAHSDVSEGLDESCECIMQDRIYPFCSGCGHKSFADVLLATLKDIGLTTDNTIFISGIGCGSIVPATFNAHLMKTSHGRSLNAARAAKLEHPDHTIIVISGDGDLINIGGNHLIHTIREKKRFPIVCFCLDNANYGMTGGQPSATTPESACASDVSAQTPFDLKKLLYDGCGIDFFARASVYDRTHLKEAITRAITAAQSGKCAFVQVFSPCTTHFMKHSKESFSRTAVGQQQGIWEREADEP